MSALHALSLAGWRVAEDTRMFQHTARFICVTTTAFIVTAAVYRGFDSELRQDCSKLTPPLNLPAPGRRQTLYVVFDFAESCVFSKQSPGPFLCDLFRLGTRSPSPYKGTPSPEVTGLICRVPKRGFSLAPVDSLLAYLCRIAVRSPFWLARGFSRQRGFS